MLSEMFLFLLFLGESLVCLHKMRQDLNLTLEQVYRDAVPHLSITCFWQLSPTTGSYENQHVCFHVTRETAKH